MLLAVSAHAQQVPAPDEQVPPEAAGAVESEDAPEPALKGQPVPDRRQHTGAEQGQAEASQQTEEADRLVPVLEAIEGAIRDLKAEEDAAERERQNQREIADLQAQQNMAFWAEAMFWATFAAVIVTTVGVILIWRTLLYTKTAAEAAVAAVGETKRAADAANITVDITRSMGEAQSRAYIHHHGIRFISHLDMEQQRIFWRIRPLWFNKGQTPARKVRTFTTRELIDAPLPHDFPFAMPSHIEFAQTSIAPNGSLESGPIVVWGDDLHAVQNGEKYLYIWGVIIYRDIFPNTPERLSKFCVHAMNVTGDPRAAYNVDSNTVDIDFATYVKHNCEDEDCE